MSSGDKMAPFMASEMAWVCHVIFFIYVYIHTNYSTSKIDKSSMSSFISLSMMSMMERLSIVTNCNGQAAPLYLVQSVPSPHTGLALVSHLHI